MDLKQLIYIALLVGFVSLAFWTKPEEQTKGGELCAFFRGFRIVSPVIFITYIYMMYDLIFIDCISDTAGKLFAGTFYTLVFAAPLPYFITRKLNLNNGSLTAYNVFTGKKTVKIKNIMHIKKSKLWGGMVISTPDEKIVIEQLLSGSEALIDYVKANSSNN